MASGNTEFIIDIEENENDNEEVRDSIDDAKDYAIGLANSLVDVDMDIFFKDIHSKFFSDEDISFMDSFLKLCSKRNQFIIPHTNLVKFGVMTSTRSNDVMKKLKALSLKQNVDYLLRHVSQQDDSGTKNAIQYLLTPKSFKLCLIRAQEREGQTKNPKMFAKYYLLLEEIYSLYLNYLSIYRAKLNSILHSDNEQLQKDKIELNDNIKELKSDMRELIDHTKDVKDDLKEKDKKIDKLQDDVTETKEEVVFVKEVLVEKCKKTTRDPSDDSKVHTFAATTYTKRDGTIVVKYTQGQRSYVVNTIEAYVENNNHEIIIEPFEHANGTDLRYNLRDEVNKHRKALVKKLKNEKAKKLAALKREINRYNRTRGDDVEERSFYEESKQFKTTYLSDITVVHNLVSFNYINNPYMSLQDVLDIVVNTVKDIHTSPVE